MKLAETCTKRVKVFSINRFLLLSFIPRNNWSAYCDPCVQNVKFVYCVVRSAYCVLCTVYCVKFSSRETELLFSISE